MNEAGVGRYRLSAIYTTPFCRLSVVLQPSCWELLNTKGILRLRPFVGVLAVASCGVDAAVTNQQTATELY